MKIKNINICIVYSIYWLVFIILVIIPITIPVKYVGGTILIGIGIYLIYYSYKQTKKAEQNVKQTKIQTNSRND